MNFLEGIEVEVLYHSSIRIKKGITVYIDPYKIENELHDADFIFITHEHYDHFSPEDIKKIIKPDTIIISVPNVIKESPNLQQDDEKRIAVKPNEIYEFPDIKVETVVAYNKIKPFHPKSKDWVGFIITLDKIRIYIAGDTDNLEELRTINCDLALVPIGGTYTMNYKEAANLVNYITPKYAIPTHYGSIVGKTEDAIKFKEQVRNDIIVEILM